eukprot:UN04080
MAAYSRWDVQEEHVIHLERQVFKRWSFAWMIYFLTTLQSAFLDD